MFLKTILRIQNISTQSKNPPLIYW